VGRKEITIKELHKFFYKEHQLMYTQIIEFISKHGVRLINDLKYFYTRHLNLRNNCFGCELAKSDKFCFCYSCFLNLFQQNACSLGIYNKLYMITKKAQMTGIDDFAIRKDAIKYATLVKNCGYHIVPECESKMRDLYDRMHKKSEV